VNFTEKFSPVATDINKSCHSIKFIFLGQLERCRSGLLGRQLTKEVISRAIRYAGIARFYEE